VADRQLQEARELLVKLAERIPATANAEREYDALVVALDALVARVEQAEREAEDAAAEAATNEAPSAMVTSGGWQCPVCDRPGSSHSERCFVGSLAGEAQRLREANRRLMETNGRVREQAEARDAADTEGAEG
jgi:DNA repair exonuclease SbcCD ATPase subunit